MSQEFKIQFDDHKIFTHDDACNQSPSRRADADELFSNENRNIASTHHSDQLQTHILNSLLSLDQTINLRASTERSLHLPS